MSTLMMEPAAPENTTRRDALLDELQPFIRKIKADKSVDEGALNILLARLGIPVGAFDAAQESGLIL